MDLSFLSDFWNFIVEDYAVIILSIVLLLVFFVIPTIVWMAFYMMKAITLYNLAFKAGYNKPWLAFIPIADNYLEAILPMKEFRFLGFYKDYDRGKAFWVLLLTFAVLPIGTRILLGVIYGVFAVFLVVLSLLPFGSVITLAISGAYYFIRLIVALTIRVGKIIFKTIIRVDLLDLYINETDAKMLGIISMFVMGMYPIVLLSIVKKEPKFGFNNYYTPVLLQQDEEDE